eukprot:RCo012284
MAGVGEKRKFLEDMIAAYKLTKVDPQESSSASSSTTSPAPASPVVADTVATTPAEVEALLRNDRAAFAGRTLTDEQRYEQAYKIVIEFLKSCRRFVSSEEIKEGTKLKSEVPYWRVHGVDLDEVTHPRSGQSLRTALRQLSEAQSLKASSAEHRAMERVLFNPHTDSFKWRGQYDEVRCREDILETLEVADQEATQTHERDCTGVEAAKLRHCYPGAEADLLELIAAHKVYAIVKPAKKKGSALAGGASGSAPAAVTADMLDNAVLYHKDPELAAAVSGVDEKLRQVWRSIRPPEKAQLAERIRSIPLLSQKVLAVVEDQPLESSALSGEKSKLRRDFSWKLRLKNTHLEGFDFSQPYRPVSNVLANCVSGRTSPQQASSSSAKRTHARVSTT